MVSSSQTPIQIRKATLEDATPIAELGAHVFSVTFGHSVPANELETFLEESYSTSATSADISNPAKTMFVATGPSNDILGFALLTRGTTEPCIEHVESQVELQRIYVHPSNHGSGIGKILAHTLEELAREEGFRNMWLGVWDENIKAQKVYEKLGYKRMGHHDFKIGDVIQTDYIMLKEL